MTTQAQLDTAIAADIAAAEAQVGVIESAVTAFNGWNNRFAEAIAAVKAANPTVDLTPLVEMRLKLEANTKALADAVAANQPPPAPPAPAPAPAPGEGQAPEPAPATAPAPPADPPPDPPTPPAT